MSVGNAAKARRPIGCPDCDRRYSSEEALRDHRRDSHGIDELAVIEKSPDPTCIECGATARIVGGEVVYPHRPDLYGKRFWLCECGAYCGCHGITTRALGNPCGPDTRRARMLAHEAFDPLWRSKKMARRDAYTWLSEQMGLHPEQTHIGMMTREQALEVVRHCNARGRSLAA